MRYVTTNNQHTELEHRKNNSHILCSSSANFNMDRMESMYAIKAINHTAAEEIQFILEQNHIKCHVDGLEVKTNEVITDETIVAEIFPWKMHNIDEC